MAASAAVAVAPSRLRGVANGDRKHAATAGIAMEMRADAAVVARALTVQSKANGRSRAKVPCREKDPCRTIGLSQSNGAISPSDVTNLSGWIAHNGSRVKVASNPGSTWHLNRGATRGPVQNGRETADRGMIDREKHSRAMSDPAKIGPAKTRTSNHARNHVRSL